VRERNVTLTRPEELSEVLTPDRLDILRHLRRDGAADVESLAVSLGRDGDAVQVDVAALDGLRLIVHDGGRMTAPWDALTQNIAL
ncbi:MAG TPA: hypothetical protein VGI53_16660, partial [Dyella sp.]